MGKNEPTITAVMVFVILFAGRASASFKGCFRGCAIGCLSGSEEKDNCLFECFGKCILGLHPTTLDYCKLGCAGVQCTHFISELKIEDVDKVESCVSECEVGQCSTTMTTTQSPATVPSP